MHTSFLKSIHISWCNSIICGGHQKSKKRSWLLWKSAILTICNYAKENYIQWKKNIFFCFMDLILTTDWHWALNIKMKSWFLAIILARQREYYVKYLKHDIKPYWLNSKIKMKQKKHFSWKDRNAFFHTSQERDFISWVGPVLYMLYPFGRA